MPEPYNYALNFKQPDLAADFARGMQLGEMSRQNEFELQQKQQAMALAQQKQLEQQRMQEEILRASENPTPDALLRLTIRYPELGTKFKDSIASLSERELSNVKGQAWSVYSALEQGKKDQAIQFLKNIEDSATNSGMTGHAQGAKVQREMLERADTGEVGDNAVRIGIGTFLASVDPDNYKKYMEERRYQAKAPSELKEAESKAAEAAVKAKFAESKAVQDLEKDGWDIEKLKNDMDISKQNSKIALMNTSLARETNELKRKELGLKIQDAQEKRDETIRGKASEAESTAATIDNMLSTANLALNTPKWIQTKSTGPIVSKLPTADSDVADFQETIETLKSQVFLSQVKSMKGMGALSDAEGKKLQTGLQSLELRQSREKLMSNVGEIQRLMRKARKTLSEKYGIPMPEEDVRPGAEERVITGDQ